MGENAFFENNGEFLTSKLKQKYANLSQLWTVCLLNTA